MGLAPFAVRSKCHQGGVSSKIAAYSSSHSCWLFSVMGVHPDQVSLWIKKWFWVSRSMRMGKWIRFSYPESFSIDGAEHHHVISVHLEGKVILRCLRQNVLFGDISWKSMRRVIWAVKKVSAGIEKGDFPSNVNFENSSVTPPPPDLSQRTLVVAAAT